MKIVKQPLGSSICGQCCVAMVTNKPLKEILEKFGHGHSTRTKELVKVLRKYGYKCSDRLTRFTYNLPFFGILKITYNKSHSHWVVIKNKIVYCPSGEKSKWYTYNGINNKGRITSFLEIISNYQNNTP